MDLPSALRPAADAVVRPMRTLWLLSAAHAVNHAQAVLLPLIYLKIIDEFGVSIGAVAVLAGVSSFASGMVQLSFASLTRYVPRRVLLGLGGLVFGGGQVLLGAATSFLPFAATHIAMRVGGAPQHPVGNGLLAEQFPPHRRGFAISAHISGGNVGTVTVPLLGAWLIAGVGWRWTVVLFGIPAVLIALAILVLVKEAGTDRAAARAHGSVRDAFRTIRRDRDLLWLYLSSILGGGGRGLGVVNVFVPIYLSQVVGLDDATVALMYAVLVVFSVPAPLVAGWLSDRWGRKPLIVGVYVAGACAFAVFLAAGSNVVGLWAGILLLGLFNFAESPQLQALLADIAPAGIRDASYAAYFTLAFGVGSLWVAVYGVVVELFGKTTGLGIVFAMMAAAFLLAALSVLPIRADERAAAQARAEGS
ncbi:MAG: major facilitator transporter [Chloroflexi bacterium CSP1-4]|nr:MAG: major facilitator transporter [Chloroflexi bacterium CSP1-4]